jgi:glycerate kinase
VRFCLTGNQSATAVFKGQKGYSRLFTAGLINGIGDCFTSVAVLAMVLQLTGSGMAVGISLGVLGFAGGAGFSGIAILLAGYALVRNKKRGSQ